MSRFVFLHEVIQMWKKLLPVLLFFLFISSLAQGEEKRYSISSDNGPILGPADAPITIIEFLDFQ